MTLDIAGIDAVLGGRLSDRFVDLIRIATFVLGADGAVSRGRLEDPDDKAWRRSFRMVVGVEDPEFWASSGVADLIERTLSFLSQDTFRFSFQKRKTGQARQLHFSGPEGDPCIPWGDINHVSLFSGGLDSFAGAANLTLQARSKVILVSHRSSPKILHYQKQLVADLAGLAKDRGCAPPRHVVVDVTKHLNVLRTERTQRTRSFLYAAIAGATASIVGLDEVRIYENGIIAINLPIAGSVIGSRGTRTAHPKVLLGFQKILSHVADCKMRVNNPYALKTRAEVIRTLVDTPAMDLARFTVSCAHVHKVSAMHSHCGICSQCIDRRFAFLGSGLAQHDPSSAYAHSVEFDPWTDESARSLVLGWVLRAQDYGAVRTADAFLDSFGDASRAVPPLMELLGMGSDEANAAVFGLHKRHAEVVEKAMAAIQREAASSARAGDLDAGALPMLVARRLVEGSGQAVAPRIETGIRNELRKDGDRWAVTFRNGVPVHVPDSLGIRSLSRLLRAPGKVLPLGSLLASDAGRAPVHRPAVGEGALRKLRRQIEGIEQERHRAQECCDEDAAVLCQREIDALEAIEEETYTPSNGAMVAEQRLLTELTTTVEKFAKLNPQLDSHFRQHLRLGEVCWYREPGLHWDIVDTTASDDSRQWVPVSSVVDKDNEVIRDLGRVERFCEAHGVATRRGKTKAGREHKRRRLLHKPAFDEAMRKQIKAVDDLASAADRVLTERQRRSGEMTRPNSTK